MTTKKLYALTDSEAMDPYYQDEHVTLHHGDARDVLASLPDNSVDAVVTDPPYGLANTTPAQVAETLSRWTTGDRNYTPAGRGFMGQEWDAFVPPPAVWDECYRVLKPGGHLAVFAGSRTQDLMGISVRLAGFDVRDSVAWLYGSGFPKSLDVSKAIDKAAGAEREVVGTKAVTRDMTRNGRTGDEAISPVPVKGATLDITAPATPEAARWQGWGTALKPAHEPILLARKPLEGTVAANVTTWGTGAINIDATRIGTTDKLMGGRSTSGSVKQDVYGHRPYMDDTEHVRELTERAKARQEAVTGRFPANVVLDEYAAHELDQQSGTTGGASRFFYVAKAPKRERPNVDGVQHPTVKPLALMRWLVRLLTPPGGVVLDPFAGSGTTLLAAVDEDRRAIGVELEERYCEIIAKRLA